MRRLTLRERRWIAVGLGAVALGAAFGFVVVPAWSARASAEVRLDMLKAQRPAVEDALAREAQTQAALAATRQQLAAVRARLPRTWDEAAFLAFVAAQAREAGVTVVGVDTGAGVTAGGAGNAAPASGAGTTSAAPASPAQPPAGTGATPSAATGHTGTGASNVVRRTVWVTGPYAQQVAFLAAMSRWPAAVTLERVRLFSDASAAGEDAAQWAALASPAAPVGAYTFAFPLSPEGTAELPPPPPASGRSDPFAATGTAGASAGTPSPAASAP